MNDDRTPNPQPTPAPKRSLVSRTSVVTVVAIGGVVLAGTAAIAANIGILNSTSDDELGALTAGQLETVTTPAPQVVDVFVDDTAPATSATPEVPATTLPARSPGQEYRVDDAGAVTADADGASLRITDVAPATGWTWTMSQERPDTVTLVFTGAGRTLVFTASLGADGAIRADVTEPVVVAGPTPAAAPVTLPAAPVTAASYDDDEHDEDDDEHDEHDEDEGHEYEGGDDDD